MECISIWLSTSYPKYYQQNSTLRKDTGLISLETASKPSFLPVQRETNQPTNQPTNKQTNKAIFLHVGVLGFVISYKQPGSLSNLFYAKTKHSFSTSFRSKPTINVYLWFFHFFFFFEPMSSMEDKAEVSKQKKNMSVTFSFLLCFPFYITSIVQKQQIYWVQYQVLCLTLLPLVSPPSESCAHTLRVFPPPLLQSSSQPATVFRISDCNAGKFSLR